MARGGKTREGGGGELNAAYAHALRLRLPRGPHAAVAHPSATSDGESYLYVKKTRVFPEEVYWRGASRARARGGGTHNPHGRRPWADSAVLV